MDELQARHKKEHKELQNRITQKKKQASKKTRKGVNDECDRLEVELKERQAGEFAALNGGGGDTPIEALEDLTLQTDQEGGEATATNGTASEDGGRTNGASTPSEGTNDDNQGPKKQNRQKARLARRAAEQEELAKQAAEEAKNLPDLKTQERERMLDAMKGRGLQEKEIRADGHCLYSAVADQLDQLQISLGAAPGSTPDLPGYKLVRSVAADYIEKHQDDFVPFLEEPLPDYMHKVRDTGEWGGQLELLALAKSYGVDINVLQDFGRVEKIDGGNSDKAIWLGYYKHGFGLGEHYNSLRKAG